MRLAGKQGRIEDPHIATLHCDQALFLQATEAAAGSLKHQTQVIHDILAAHRQGQDASWMNQLAVATGKPVQEEKQPVAGHASPHHLQVILIAPHALPDQARQLALERWHLRRDPFHVLQGHFTDQAGFEGFGLAAVVAGTQRIESRHFPREVEPDDLSFAVLGQDHVLPFDSDQHAIAANRLVSKLPPPPQGQSAMTLPMPSRRHFLILAATTAATALPLAALRLSGNAQAAEPSMLPADNPQAKALSYTSDATKSKHPSYKPGSNCANCQLFTAATGTCSLFAGFRVAPTGWCMAWSKRAG